MGWGTWQWGVNGRGALLQILSNGPQPGQIAAGSLVADTGQAITCTRASNAYCQDSSGLLHLLGNNQIRVEPNGILVEAAATNLMLQSNTFSNTGSWTFDNTTVAQNVTGPDGLSNSAWTWSTNTSTSQHRLYQSGMFVSGSACTWSIYAKAGTANYIGLDANNGAGQWAAFNLASGTVEQSGSASNPTIAQLGNGWYRCSISVTMGAAGFAIMWIAENNTQFGGGIGGNYTGTNKNVLIWGSQIEQTAVATSYIPTTSATVNRAADAISVANPLAANAQNWVLGGTFFPPSAVNNDMFVFSLGTNGLANSVVVSDPSQNPSMVVRDGSNNSLQVGSNKAFANGVPHRLVVTNIGGVLRIYVDGTDVTGSPTGTGTGVATLNGTLQIGGINNGGPVNVASNGWISRIYADTNLFNVPIT